MPSMYIETAVPLYSTTPWCQFPSVTVYGVVNVRSAEPKPQNCSDLLVMTSKPKFWPLRAGARQP